MTWFRKENKDEIIQRIKTEDKLRGYRIRDQLIQISTNQNNKIEELEYNLHKINRILKAILDHFKIDYKENDIKIVDRD